jgi:hypothetical protein
VQVSLRWLIQQCDVAAIPKSSSPMRAQQYFAVFEFALSDAKMAEIAKLRRPEHLVNDRPLVPAWDSAGSGSSRRSACRQRRYRRVATRVHCPFPAERGRSGDRHPAQTG